jgi:hypothetical protein
MLQKNFNNIPLYFFKNLLQYKQIVHFVTSRQGGTSQGLYSSFNLGFGVDDNPDSVSYNRKLLASSLELSLDQFVFPNQTHSDNIAIIRRKDCGRGVLNKHDAIENTDALMTNQKGIYLTIQIADCLPILIYDPLKQVICAIHAGWRGTLSQIVLKSVEKMKQEFDCAPFDIIAGIGPSIGPCCYEIGNEVAKQFEKQIPAESVVQYRKDKNPVLDLWQTNKNLLIKAGLNPEHIEISFTCTSCNHNKFYSSRYYKGNTGRFAAGIMIQ